MSAARRASVTLFMLLAGALCPLGARAQVARGGVELARLVPAGMEIVDVAVPARAEVPVRLALAPRGSQAVTLLVDVRVAPDAAAARETLAWQIRAMQGDVPRAPGLGDEGYADGGYAAFARDNVMIAVRTVDGAPADVRALASAFDAAVLASPAGATRASVRVQLPVVSAMREGDVARVALPAGALDASLEASGDVSARRVRDGFVVTRTRSGAAQLTLVVVDERLRTSL